MTEGRGYYTMRGCRRNPFGPDVFCVDRHERGAPNRLVAVCDTREEAVTRCAEANEQALDLPALKPRTVAARPTVTQVMNQVYRELPGQGVTLELVNGRNAFRPEGGQRG